MLGSIGPWELILILAIALLIFGPGKLPEAGKALGNSIREFKKACAPTEADPGNREIGKSAVLTPKNNVADTAE